MCFLPGFCECGWASFGILLLTALGLLVGVIAIALGALRKGWLAAGMGIAVVCLGLTDGAVGMAGMLHGRGMVEDAVSGASVAPEQKQRIVEIGYQEAQTCVTAGALNGGMLVVFGAAAAGLALALRRKKT